MSDERLLHTQEVHCSNQCAPTTKPIIPLSCSISSNNSIGPDPLLATEKPSSFGSSLAATPENDTPESCAVSVQSGNQSTFLVRSNGVRQVGKIHISNCFVHRESGSHPEQIFENQPFFIIREATKDEYLAQCRRKGLSASEPFTETHFYEVTTD